MARPAAPGDRRFTHLLSPGHIGTMRVRNRIIMSPMGDNLAEPDGTVGKREAAYFEARARGGAGLILVGTVSVLSWVRGHAAVSDDRFIPGLAALARRVQAHGARLGLQLVYHRNTEADRAANRPFLVPSPPEPSPPDPVMMLTAEEAAKMSSAVPSKISYREMTRDDIALVVEAFAAAAERAQRAGMDGVEIHSTHGYLLDNFLSPLTNRRADEYGGSLENRARFLLEVLSAIRTRVGRAYPVWCRINGTEFLCAGNTVEEAKQVAAWAEEAGADAVHVSAYGDGKRAIIWTEAVTTQEPARLVPYAAAIKRHITVPVIAVGRIEPELADRLIEQGAVDFVAMGRKLIADPELPNKLAAGRQADVRPCIYQYRCISQIFVGEPLRCGANPATGRERQFEIVPAARPRTVLVAGGGPAGLEAARIATLRGHRVILCEATPRLGGTALLSSLVNEANGELVDYLVTQVRQLPIEVRLQQAVTPVLVRDLAPDVVVVAVGARHDTSHILGAHRAHVLNGHDLRALVMGSDSALAMAKLSLRERTLLRMGHLIAGSLPMARIRQLTRRWMPLGQRVGVVGGGLVGVELAEFLANRGRQVTLFDAGTVLAQDMAPLRRWRAVHELKERGVTLLTQTHVEEIAEAGIVYTDAGGERKVVAVDSVILALGMTENRSLLDGLAGTAAEVHVIGDCGGVGYIEKALEEAATVALSI